MLLVFAAGIKLHHSFRCYRPSATAELLRWVAASLKHSNSEKNLQNDVFVACCYCCSCGRVFRDVCPVTVLAYHRQQFRSWSPWSDAAFQTKMITDILQCFTHGCIQHSCWFLRYLPADHTKQSTQATQTPSSHHPESERPLREHIAFLCHCYRPGKALSSLGHGGQKI